MILGKANLSEWANFRGMRSINGWSARGGFTRNPYALDRDPSGSTSGSAVAVAANLAAVAVGHGDGRLDRLPGGRERDRRHEADASASSSQEGIIPIAHSQDTAGPMCDGAPTPRCCSRLRVLFGRLWVSASHDYSAFSTQARSRACASPTTGATPTATGRVTTICSPWSTALEEMRAAGA